MAKIEITGSPQELDRVAIFLKNNNIKFKVAKDHGPEEQRLFNELEDKFK